MSQQNGMLPPALNKGAVNPADLSLPLYGATPGQALKRFFRGYVKLNGRASRSEFWWPQLLMLLVRIVILLPFLIIYYEEISGPVSWYAASFRIYGFEAFIIEDFDIFYFLELLFFIGTPQISLLLFLNALLSMILFLPSFAVTWRRLQDANLHGALTWLGLVPLINLVLVVFTLLPSKAAGQRFDPVPGSRLADLYNGFAPVPGVARRRRGAVVLENK